MYANKNLYHKTYITEMYITNMFWKSDWICRLSFCTTHIYIYLSMYAAKPTMYADKPTMYADKPTIGKI